MLEKGREQVVSRGRPEREAQGGEKETDRRGPGQPCTVSIRAVQHHGAQDIGMRQPHAFPTHDSSHRFVSHPHSEEPPYPRTPVPPYPRTLFASTRVPSASLPRRPRPTDHLNLTISSP